METRRVWFSMQFIVGVGTDRLHRFAAKSCCFCRCSLDPPGRILPSCAPRLWWIEELPRISITNVAWHLTNRQPGSLHWGSCWKPGFCSWPKHWCWPQHHWLLICWMEMYPVKDLKVNKHKPYYWRIPELFKKVVVGTCRCLSAGGRQETGDRKVFVEPRHGLICFNLPRQEIRRSDLCRWYCEMWGHLELMKYSIVPSYGEVL